MPKPLAGRYSTFTCLFPARTSIHQFPSARSGASSSTTLLGSLSLMSVFKFSICFSIFCLCNMEKQIENLKTLIRERLPRSVVELDAPDRADGNWWIDVRAGKRHVKVEYRPAKGFGIFNSDAGYGEGPAEVYRTAELAARRLAQLFVSSKSKRSRLTLKDLRE